VPGAVRSADAVKTTINVKRVYEPPNASDGRRILVERLWPRGVRRDAIGLDRWAKELGASDALRRWYGHVPDRWPEFQRRYRAELIQHPEHWRELVELARTEPLTLLFSARDKERNNAVALAAFLVERLLEAEKAG
jgi:uncharacterized protein YeaO (DUF488 family)